MSEQVTIKAYCLDCGKDYEEFPLDTVLPNDQWAMINPALGGVLCANCMVERASKIKGVIVARIVFEDSYGTPFKCTTP